MMSRFLPADFDPSKGCIGLVAGKGRYPELLREAIITAELRCVLIAFEGETETAFIQQFAEADRIVAKVGQVGKTAKGLASLGATHAIMAGQITPRRLFDGLHPDLTALQILARLKERNAETIFSAIGDEIEKRGVTMLDARTFLDDHLAHAGLMTNGSKFGAAEQLDHGIHIAKEVARLDIGQGAVVSEGTVIAVEAFEGTDAMLRRAGEFGAKNVLFIKTVKPNQDYRYDVPVFGDKTLESLRAAGIRHVALEAGHTLILNKPAVLKAAQKAKIQVYGYTA